MPAPIGLSFVGNSLTGPHVILPRAMTPYHSAGFRSGDPAAEASIRLAQSYIRAINEASMGYQTMTNNNNTNSRVMATSSLANVTDSDETSSSDQRHQQQGQERNNNNYDYDYYDYYLPEITTEELIIGIVLKDLPACVFFLFRQAVILALCAVLGLIEFSCVMAFRFSLFLYMVVFAFADWGYSICFGALRLVGGVARGAAKGVWRVGKAISSLFG